MSLKMALERLLGGPCYHMVEVFANPSHIAVWLDAVRGRPPVWGEFLSGYLAAVDMPASAFWRELMSMDDDALVVLSVRDRPEDWWDSMSRTILDPARPQPTGDPRFAQFTEMATTVWASRIGPRDLSRPGEMMRSYEEHNAAVRAEVPGGRLLEWRAPDGWAPLAAALGVPEPDEPFPRVNTRDEFRQRDLRRTTDES